MNLGPVARHYGALEPHERFTLMVEAMGRKDNAEADRLEESCPRFVYRQEDVEFRDRMKRSFSIACLVCLNMREGLAQVRMAAQFVELCGEFSEAPARVAQVAFLYGRALGRSELGMQGLGEPEMTSLAAEVETDPWLKQQVDLVREAAGEATRQVAKTLHYAIGEMHAANLLSQWEGFGRFCRKDLGVEPTMLLRAFGLGGSDPAADVTAAYPDARVDEAEAARWAGHWTGGWERRFGPQR